VSIVLLGPYTQLLADIMNRYPGGTARAGVRGDLLDYYAYELPPDE
jgi:hypothetical protein